MGMAVAVVMVVGIFGFAALQLLGPIVGILRAESEGDIPGWLALLALAGFAVVVGGMCVALA